jgi:hypothetical protein
MANQITIDIVAETKKLTSGINDANSQIDGMSSKLKGAAAAAGAAASAFVLKQGVTFLKQGIDEAKEAQETMRAATTTFGEGSAALAKITADADKFGKAIAVDNDVIIQLATQLGSRLPADSKASSAALVNLAFDVQAYTAGALPAEAVTSKLAKAFVDGELTAKEMSKIIPDLDDATYKMAETMSKAGDNQGALNLLIDAGQKKYGDAAEKNVTASQKLDVTLANLKETIGAKLLPTIEKLIGFVTTAIEKFSALPGPVQNVILAITALVAIGGPLLSFLASAKTAMVTLGLVSEASAVGIGASTIAANLLRIALAGLGIGLVIAAIVLLVQNWDSITEAVNTFWEKIKDVVPKAWAKVMELKDKIVGYIDTIKDVFNAIPGALLNVGKDIVIGLWNGMQSMAGWLKTRVLDFFGNLVPSWAKKMLGINSPSTVFAAFGKNIVQGLAQGINSAENIAKTATLSLGSATVSGLSMPSISRPRSTSGVNITINAGVGTDPYALGRAVKGALNTYSGVYGS